MKSLMKAVKMYTKGLDRNTLVKEVTNTIYELSQPIVENYLFSAWIKGKTRVSNEAVYIRKLLLILMLNTLHTSTSILISLTVK